MGDEEKIKKRREEGKKNKEKNLEQQYCADTIIRKIEKSIFLILSY